VEYSEQEEYSAQESGSEENEKDLSTADADLVPENNSADDAEQNHLTDVQVRIKYVKMFF